MSLVLVQTVPLSRFFFSLSFRCLIYTAPVLLLLSSYASHAGFKFAVVIYLSFSSSVFLSLAKHVRTYIQKIIRLSTDVLRVTHTHTCAPSMRGTRSHRCNTQAK